MSGLPDTVYGTRWLDGDTGTEHMELDLFPVKEDPSDVEKRTYVAVDALLSDGVIERADKLVPAHPIEHPRTVRLVAEALVAALSETEERDA